MSNIFQDEVLPIAEARRNLCRKASYKAINATERLKEEMRKNHYELDKALSDQLVPECIYRCGCPDPGNCDYFNELIDIDPDCASPDISRRYNAYNKIFWAKRKAKEEDLLKSVTQYDTYAYLKSNYIMLIIDTTPLKFSAFEIIRIECQFGRLIEETILTVYTKHYSFGLRRINTPICSEPSDKSIDTIYRVISISRE